MKKLISTLLLCLIVAGVFCSLAVTSVSADENYNDHSNEWSDGPGEAPEDGAARDEPRTRFKDR